MRICFLVNEIFGWGRYGGFGSLTRTIGRNLVKKGIEVFVVTKRREGQQSIEKLDGMTIFGAQSLLEKLRYCRLSDAGIYQTEEPYSSTYLAMKATPKKKHIIVFQDPRNKNDYKILAEIDPSLSCSYPRSLTGEIRVAFEDWLTNRAIKKADALFCQAKYVIPKVMKMYQLEKAPTFLPNPVEISNRQIRKADMPTVCFLARWDPVKRIEIFFELAKKFPSVKFIAPGKAHDQKRDQYLRKRYSTLPNLEIPGFVSEQKKSEILKRSWIMMNTSLRECLPVAFLEACAHKCAILSCNNPDNFASNFGFYVQDGNFSIGLKNLLENMRWKEKGERGFKYIKEVHELNKVIDQHINIYNKLSSD
jgi:glycosyltransferase involved in cell wall biosynthesis